MKKGIFGALLLIAGMTVSIDGHSKDKASKSKVATETAGPAALDTASVRALVKSKMLEVQQCYTDLIIEGMAKAGSVGVTWKIDDQGAVQDLTITTNTANDQALGGCVTEKVQHWVFPAANAGETFAASYTFKFGT